MICAIMQPTYLPWLGYFDLIDKVDAFVFLDDVDYAKQSWQVRNRICHRGEPLWLSIPVSKPKKEEGLKKIKDIKISDVVNWRKKHVSAIEQSYAKASFRKDLDEVLTLVRRSNTLLADYNIGIIVGLMDSLGISTPTIRSSELSITESAKDHRLVKICEALGSDNYLSPLGSKEYIDSKTPGGAFSASKINLLYHQYEHPAYKQLSDEFLSHLSIIDLIANVGFDESLATIKSGRRTNS